MQTNSSYPTKFVASLLITGLGIGWLIGLSISPVVSIVITSITGSAAAIVAAMSGLEHEPRTDNNDDNNTQNYDRRWKVNPIPIALLVFGIVVGSTIGITFRTRDWLGGSDISSEIKQWSDAGLNSEEVARRLFESRYSYRGWLGTDLSAEVEKWTEAGLTNQEEVARRLLESTYPLDIELTTNPTETDAGSNSTRGVLFTVGTTECASLMKALARSHTNLVEELGRIEGLKNLPDIITDSQALERIITEVICLLE